MPKNKNTVIKKAQQQQYSYTENLNKKNAIIKTA